MSLRNSIKKAVLSGSGMPISIQRVITSSNITVAAKDFSAAATGRIYIYDVIFKTDATGLGGATNFQITTTNARGQSIVLAEAVANLGANKTVTIQNPKAQTSLAGGAVETVLEAGAKLQYNGTVAAGTGAGTIEVTIIGEIIDAGATLQVSNA